MLSNAYFLAKFRFDTAENEPAKNLQNFVKNFPKKSALTQTEALRDQEGTQAEAAHLCRDQPTGCSSVSAKKPRQFQAVGDNHGEDEGLNHG